MTNNLLPDEGAIQRALSQFARILDEKRWDDLDTVFAGDVSFDYGTGEEQEGIEALRDTMTRFLERCGQTQHLIGSVLVDVSRDVATSRAYVQARHAGTGNLAGSIFDTNGEYIDRWLRRDGRWRIVRRDVRWFAFSGDPNVIGMN